MRRRMVIEKQTHLEGSTAMKQFLLSLVLLATSSGWALPIYSSGNFKDPSPSTVLGPQWVGGFSGPNGDFSAITLADSFALPSGGTVNGVDLWTYDSTDGTAGVLKQVKYTIYAGGAQPGGTPVDSGFGTITSSTT